MRALLYIGVLFSAVSCGSEGPALHPGDLLFEAGADTRMTGAIRAATGREGELSFTHVAIVAGSGRADSVIEAATEGGVRILPLDEFLARASKIGARPGVVAMRLRDTAGVKAAVRRARTFLGQPYDYAYRPDNGRMYCSELVWESYRAADGSPLFRAQPMRFRAADGTMPAFWRELFKALGEPVPEGVPGTNPNDMAHEACLREIYRWF